MSSKGWPSQEKEERIVAQYATIEPVRTLQHSLSVLAHQFVREIGTDLVEAGSTTIAIQATSHLALSGDVIRFTSGVLSGQEVKVYAVSVNAIQLAEKLSVAPSAGDGFQILRHKYPVVEPTGEVKISGSFTEVATAADGGALPALTKVVSGYDGAAVQALKTDSDGELQVDVLSSALPTGAATSANQTSTNNLLTTIDADTGTLAACVTSNQVQTEINTIKGLVDSSNSSNTPLGIGGIYTGAWVENKNYASIQVGVKADQNSATDGLVMQFSSDGVTVHHTHQYSYLSASGGIGYLFQPEFKYYRIVFTNGAVAQTSFTLQTTVRSVPLIPSQYRVSNPVTNETQVLMTRSVITGASSAGGGTFVNVKVSPSGALNTEATLAGLDPAVLGQDTMANSLPVVLASNQTAIPVTDNGSSLTVDGTVSATQSGTWNINNVSGTVSLPTGAATETTLAAVKTSVELLDNAVSGNELQVDIVSAPTLATNQVGRTVQNRARLDYSLTNVTTGAYVQLLASTSGAVSEIEIFDSSGQTLVLATGAALSEVDQIYVFPGGNGRVPLSIAGSTRVSIKAVSATANSGEIAINFYS